MRGPRQSLEAGALVKVVPEADHLGRPAGSRQPHIRKRQAAAGGRRRGEHVAGVFADHPIFENAERLAVARIESNPARDVHRNFLT